MERSSGILLPMSALPSPYGVGTMGKAAYEFVDFLKAAGQKYWQMLPLGHTGPGGAPYTSVSTFAGNPNYIDLDLLCEDGLLSLSDMPPIASGCVDYASLDQSRESVLRKAFNTGWEKYAEDVKRFADATPWLESYGLYMALKRHFDGRPWYQWPEDIKRRQPQAVCRYTTELQEDICYYEFFQFLFFRQWAALRKYAHEARVIIIGDIPIYVALDSADVWAEPQFFLLDEDFTPTEVSGVPPDYFAKEGQLWGNPLYDWDKMRADGWGWWIRRVDGAAKLYDVVRIDHFRAFASYWAVPAGEKTAKNGQWRQGPGMALVGTLINWFSGTQFVAEDLGMLTPDVGELIKASGLPGMKVLEFAFSPDGTSSYLPHKYDRNCVCYAGTHDNNTIMGWLADCTAEEREFAQKYMNVSGREGWCWSMLRCGMASVADLFVAQMQDVLEKPGDFRTNTPGTVEGNWQWRLKPGELTGELAKKLYEYTKLYGRI